MIHLMNLEIFAILQMLEGLLINIILSFINIMNNDLILKYEESHILYYFEHNVLPYEDKFVFYGNSNYCYYSNPMVDICFLYFYRNKMMNCLIDGIEHEKINNCIIFDGKYLIVHLFKKIKKYLILNDNISSVSYILKDLIF